MTKAITTRPLPVTPRVKEAWDDVGNCFERFCLTAGIEALQAMLEADASELCGQRHARSIGRVGYRWGTAQGKVPFHGGNVDVARPRVRRCGNGGREMELPTWADAMRQEWLGKWAMNLMLINVSTRKIGRAVRLPEDGIPITDGDGTSKSAASRRFVALSSDRLAEFMAADLSKLDLLVIQIDGLHVTKELVLLAAIGIDAQGRKHPLGLVEGTSENRATAQALIDCLVGRGLDPSLCRLFVVDGAKALTSAIRRTFGRHTPIQRCQVHKARNVVERCPKKHVAGVKRALRQAWEEDDADKAERQLKELARRIEREAPGVAGSIREGLDEMLTVSRLGLPKALRRALACTNAIENMQGTIRRVSRNVKRWQHAEMALRWAAAGMMEAAKGFRRLKAYRQLPCPAGGARRACQPQRSRCARAQGCIASCPSNAASRKFNNGRGIPEFARYGGYVAVGDRMRFFTDEAKPKEVRAHPYLGQKLKQSEVRKYLPATRRDINDWASVAPEEELAALRKAGYFLDLWHWRAHRSNPIDVSDDEYVFEVRSGDAGSGPFTDNWDPEKKQPRFMLDPDKSGRRALRWEDLIERKLGFDDDYFISETTAKPFDASHEWQEGDAIPRRLLRPGQGSHGDIKVAGKARWRDGSWDVTLVRAMDTGHPMDDKILLDKHVYNLAFAVHRDATGSRWHYVSLPVTLGLGRDAELMAVRFEGDAPQWQQAWFDLVLFYPGQVSWPHLNSAKHAGADKIKAGVPVKSRHSEIQLAHYGVEGEFTDAIKWQWTLTMVAGVLLIIGFGIALNGLAGRTGG